MNQRQNSIHTYSFSYKKRGSNIITSHGWDLGTGVSISPSHSVWGIQESKLQRWKMKWIWITWHCNKVLKHISYSPLSINLNQYHWERNLCHRGILKCQTLWYSFMGASDTLSLGIHFYEGKLCVVEELIRFIGRKYLLKWDKILMDLCNILGKMILFHGVHFV